MSPLNMRSLTSLPLAAVLKSISAAPFYPVTTELDSRGVGGTGASVLGSVASLISSLLPKATSAWVCNYLYLSLINSAKVVARITTNSQACVG